MLIFDQIKQDIDKVKKSTPVVSAEKVLSLIDLTSLNESDSPSNIATLCNQAVTTYGHVAAVCIYPQFVKQVATQLTHAPVKIATVANFPYASDSLSTVTQSITQSIKEGAQEIDVVFPYPQYLAGDQAGAQAFIQACKLVCGEKVLLKVILETGKLDSYELVAGISRAAILAGADFIKTSTGKLGTGATLEAAAVMLITIREMTAELKRTIGFKASGGIRTIDQAAQFIELANHILGKDWVNPKTFRLGTSQLCENVLAMLKKMSCPL